MGEVMICRGSSGGSSNAGKEKVFTSFLFETNQNWVVPEGIVNNELKVRLFGGGQGGTDSQYGLCGNGGSMNNDIIKVSPGEIIPITIGDGGVVGDINTVGQGGTTSFGLYLSAVGGMGSGGAGRDGAQFGGGGGLVYSHNYLCAKEYSLGGSGGIWGGGGGGGYHYNSSSNSNYPYNKKYGGNGGLYGGGGASCNWIYSDFTDLTPVTSGTIPYNVGCGGKYGGGGASCIAGGNNMWGPFGGEYGGNGGMFRNNILAENGTNTSSWINVDIDERSNEYLRGSGLGGQSINKNRYPGGGGGFGGNGGIYYGGGGGYGSNGGSWCGGGGGYGGDGGNYGGGGGGYGKTAIGGGYNYYLLSNGGGGGYYCPGSNKGGGGGFLYKSNKYACGGDHKSAGQPGCILVEFYRWL